MYYKDHWIHNLDETHGKQNGFGVDFRFHLTASQLHTLLSHVIVMFVYCTVLARIHPAP